MYKSHGFQVKTETTLTARFTVCYKEFANRLKYSDHQLICTRFSVRHELSRSFLHWFRASLRAEVSILIISSTCEWICGWRSSRSVLFENTYIPETLWTPPIPPLHITWTPKYTIETVRSPNLLQNHCSIALRWDETGDRIRQQCRIPAACNNIVSRHYQ